jgi:3-mercaptopyruvate sulfurtransferase SseA
MPRLIYAAMILAVAVVLVSCNAVDTRVNSSSQTPAASPETAHADGARRITTSELEQMLKDGQAVVLDVRNQEMYDVGHIPGSRLIPAEEIANHLNELPRDKMIVTYCS